MKLLTAIRVYARVVETGSFTAVSRELGITQPTVSKHVAALEAHLGTRLFHRSTRQLTLTDDGRTYYEHCLQILEAIDTADAAVGPRQSVPTGLLRAGSPAALARRYVAPRLRRFLDLYPDLQVELLTNDGFDDLVEQGIDVSVRVGSFQEVSLVARPVGASRMMALASPEYLERHGVPRIPEDLRGHECIVYSHYSSGTEWSFFRAGERLAVRVKGRLRVNGGEALRAAALAGVGIAYAPAWLFQEDLDSGLVQPLLTHYQGCLAPIQVVYPSRRSVPAKVRAFADFIAEEFRNEPMIAPEREGC